MCIPFATGPHNFGLIGSRLRINLQISHMVPFLSRSIGGEPEDRYLEAVWVRGFDQSRMPQPSNRIGGAPDRGGGS
jgi:hypothetical protein